MKLSIASSVYLNYSIQDAIRHVSDAGYDGIDIWGGRPHVYRRDQTPAELDQIRASLEGNNLTLVSFMPAFFRYPHSLSSPNEVVRQDSLEYMRLCLENAVALGAKTLLIVPSRSLHGQGVVEARKRLADSIATICEFAQPYGMQLGLEPANRMVTDLVNTAGEALEVIAEVGDPRLGVVLDSGHINLVDEQTRQAIEKLAGRLLQVHINDNDGITQQNLIPGDGNFDFGEMFQVLKEVRYDGFLSAELGYQYTDDPNPAVQLTARRMREMSQ
jgi:protein FrlC